VIELAWPWALAAAPLPLLTRWLLPKARPEAPPQALRVPFFRELGTTPSSAPGSRPRALLLAALLAWLLLLLAAARPQWVGAPVTLPVSGRDLMLALDVSGSMKVPDLVAGTEVTRLAVIKEVAGRFITRREGDRIGLILFGTRAYLQVPLTFDRQTVQALLGEAEIGLAGEQTAIGDAIGLAVKRLRAESGQQRVLVLLTDGASNAGEVDPRQAARLAAAAGLRIYTIGVGADRMRVNTLFGARRVNPSADLDEATLQAIADTTGGAYFRARDAEGLEQIYQRIDALEPTVRATQVFRPVRALYFWPLGAALLLSVLVAVTRTARPRLALRRAAKQPAVAA
jgi:Ca-activated chloride channel family protein